MPPSERPSAAIGSRLRDARQRRGVTLRTIADKTKISMGALEALERNDISKLPGGIFSRAFVRSYAIEVGLDPEETVHDFIVQFPNDSVTAGHPAASPIEDNEAIESSRTIARTILWLLVLSVPLMGAVLYFGMAGRPNPSAQELGTAPAPVHESAADPVAAAPHLSDAVDPSREATPASTTGGGAAAPVPAAPASAAKPEGTSGTLASALSQDRLSIGVVATGRTRIALTVDGVAAPERQLLGGERQVIEAQRDFVVWVEDAGALQLTINGAQVRQLGDSGEPAMVRLNLANFRRYLTTQ